MSGPIVRTGTNPAFWANWDNVFGGKKKTASAPKSAAPAKGAAKKSAKKSAPKKGAATPVAKKAPAKKPAPKKASRGKKK